MDECKCRSPKHARLQASRGHVRAFTLIELLVVVSILALLISILLPSLQKARNQAKATVCLCNLKQTGNAIMYYATDWPDCLPPYRIVRPINDKPADQVNTPYWFQYLPLMYLDNHFGVGRCPADTLEDVDAGGLRGPYRELESLRQVVYYSYAMNPNQPKKQSPVYPDLPYTETYIVERFNPGRITGLKRPAEFAFLLETNSTGLLNPWSPYEYFRLDHGSKKMRMNLIFGDTHAQPKHIREIFPGDFSNYPPLLIESATDWPNGIRALWFGDEKLTSPRYF